jgi:hypothetical protein
VKVLPSGIFEVLVDITLRINDHSCLALFVPYQIGSVRQAAQVVLLKDHLFIPIFFLTGGGQNGRLQVMGLVI